MNFLIESEVNEDLVKYISLCCYIILSFGSVNVGRGLSELFKIQLAFIYNHHTYFSCGLHTFVDNIKRAVKGG